MTRTISINCAPVLTLWAAVVAERLGFEWGSDLLLWVYETSIRKVRSCKVG